YTGRKLVIPSGLADTPCATLGVQGLLNQLNATLGTTYSLDDPFLSSLLKDCIRNGDDFGRTYSYLRRIWYTVDWSTIRDIFWSQQEEDWEKRRKALVGNQIVDPDLPPRHRLPPVPISHAWVDEKDRTTVWTPINGYEWPVPIPKDADLNLIRIELLNLGVEYAWLDVLCLRQVGGWREDLRIEEWKLDVPTIGNVYHEMEVVIYLTGLGRPLTLNKGDLESDRSWFRRAWTLQEVGEWRVIAGDTPDGPLHAECKDGKYETELLTRFHKQLQCATDAYWEIHKTLEMRTRVSTIPVDKIAGLTFLMCSRWIPAYYESASLEDAWTALVHSMHGTCRLELFLLCPEPGNGGPKWRPSWDQVMTKPLLPHQSINSLDEKGDDDDDLDWCEGECIDGIVRGLAAVEGDDRHGEFIVECDDGINRFKVTAAHTYCCETGGSSSFPVCMHSVQANSIALG
ncbi:hypothetical protein EDD18DRAFT_1376254, partial [Armillaria luteobubalina]